MSPWDRKREIRRYERMFEDADPEEIIEQLGTPTKVAVELAQDYVATPPPDTSRWDNLPDPLPDETEEDDLLLEEEPELPAPKRRIHSGGVIGFCLFLLILGIPIAAVLICFGLPFFTVGVAVIGVIVETVILGFRTFNLLSDLLVTIGAGLILAAVGLVLAWLGLWISISLCRLWILKVLLPLGRKLCFRKEAQPNG